jgi:hypothetical protein
LYQSIISDYEFYMMEKEYNKICGILEIEKELRVTEFIGWNIKIPMSLYSFKKDSNTCKNCNYLESISLPNDFGNCKLSKIFTNGQMMSGCGLKTNENFSCKSFIYKNE